MNSEQTYALVDQLKAEKAKNAELEASLATTHEIITAHEAAYRKLQEELENAYAFEPEPNLSIDQLIEICKAYTKLGWAVQEQAEDWLYNGRILDEMGESGAINGNALGMIVEWMTRNLSDDIVQDAEGLVDEANAFLMGDEAE